MKLEAAVIKSLTDESERHVKFLVDEQTGETVSVWVKEVFGDEERERVTWREYR